MNQNELRTGNYYLYKGSEIKFDISDFKEIDHNLLDLLKPIPLTEDWLIKFGFIPIDDDGLFGNESEPLFQLQNRYLADDGFDFVFDTSILNKEELPVKHVHQLQSLYFVLISEELKYKKNV